jgi:2-iminobutanoate/2-iminopropanoate deaminase
VRQKKYPKSGVTINALALVVVDDFRSGVIFLSPQSQSTERQGLPRMTKREIKHPEKLTATGSYSAGVYADGWLFISGQGPLDLRTGQVVHGSIGEETRLTMQHIGKILAAAECNFNDVVKCTCHLSNIADFEQFDRVYSEFFTGILPARTTVQAVLWGGIKVEIDAIARKI